MGGFNSKAENRLNKLQEELESLKQRQKSKDNEITLLKTSLKISNLNIMDLQNEIRCMRIEISEQLSKENEIQEELNLTKENLINLQTKMKSLKDQISTEISTEILEKVEMSQKELKTELSNIRQKDSEGVEEAFENVRNFANGVTEALDTMKNNFDLLKNEAIEITEEIEVIKVELNDLKMAETKVPSLNLTPEFKSTEEILNDTNERLLQIQETVKEMNLNRTQEIEGEESICNGDEISQSSGFESL